MRVSYIRQLCQFPLDGRIMRLSYLLRTSCGCHLTELKAPSDSIFYFERTISSSPKSCEIQHQEINNNVDHVTKKKCALLLAYSGAGYCGMQIHYNIKIKTIEQDLLAALYQAGLIGEVEREIPQSMNFQRASRTDKGVSAAAQTISLNLPLVDNLIEVINQHLPENIRVLAYTPVTRRFDCKSMCDARTYSYMLPTFAFAPVNQVIKEDYRISDDVFDEVKSLFKLLNGSHFFHNYTENKRPHEPSTRRIIMDIECQPPFVQSGLEFIVIRIKGQSFMFHQIRKMIGMVIAIRRGCIDKSMIDTSWQNFKVDIPIAPGLGLILEQVHFDCYNKKHAKPGICSSIDWSQYEDSIKKFKEEKICPTIVNGEIKDKSMLYWLSTLPLNIFGVREPGSNRPPFSALGLAWFQLYKLNKIKNNELKS